MLEPILSTVFDLVCLPLCSCFDKPPSQDLVAMLESVKVTVADFTAVMKPRVDDSTVDARGLAV